MKLLHCGNLTGYIFCSRPSISARSLYYIAMKYRPPRILSVLSVTNQLLSCPPITSEFGCRFFSCSPPHIWNNLLLHIGLQNCPSVHSFCPSKTLQNLPVELNSRIATWRLPAPEFIYSCHCAHYKLSC